MKSITIVVAFTLLGCTQLKAVGAGFTAGTHKNQVQPGPTQKPSTGSASASPTGPASSEPAPAATEPAMIGGGHGRGKKGGGASAIGKAFGPDIAGVQLGMSYDQAHGQIEKFVAGKGQLQGTDGVTALNSSKKAGAAGQAAPIAYLRWNGAQGESIEVAFTQGAKPIVVKITRSIGSTSEADIKGAISKKYGQPSYAEQNQYIWSYGTNGRQIAMDKPCFPMAVGMVSSASTRGIVDTGQCPEIDIVLKIWLANGPASGVINNSQFMIASRTMNTFALQQSNQKQRDQQNAKDQEVQKQAQQNKTSL